MIFHGKPRTGARTWRALLVVMAVCSLTFSLATRFSMPVSTGDHGVKSIDDRSGENKHQRLDKVTNRLGPVVTRTVFQPAALYAHIIPAEPPLCSYHLSDSLYDRPPPHSLHSS